MASRISGLISCPCIIALPPSDERILALLASISVLVPELLRSEEPTRFLYPHPSWQSRAKARSCPPEICNARHSCVATYFSDTTSIPPLWSPTFAATGLAAGRTKNTYLGAVYRRIVARRGRKRAAIAVGRRILEIAYYVLRDGVAYEDLGANFYDEHKKDAVVRTAVKRLERLGYKVTVEAA